MAISHREKLFLLLLFSLFFINSILVARAAESPHYTRADLTNNLKDSSNCPGWSGMIQWAIQTGGNCNTGGSFTVLNCLNDQTKKISPGETIQGECRLSELPPGDLSAYCLRITWCGKTRDLSGVRDDEHLRSETGGPVAVAEVGVAGGSRGSSLTVEIDRPLVFYADKSSDPGGRITKYSWDFLGYSPIDTDKSVYTLVSGFSVVGVFTVVLTVTDDKGDSAKAEPLSVSVLQNGRVPADSCAGRGGACGCACSAGEVFTKVPGASDCEDHCCKCAAKPALVCSALGGSCTCPVGQECKTDNKVSGSSDCDSCCKCTAKSVDGVPVASLFVSKQGMAKVESVIAGVGEVLDFDPTGSTVPSGYSLETWTVNFVYKKDGAVVDRYGGDWNQAPLRVLSHSYDSAGVYTVLLSLYILGPGREELTFTDEVTVDVSSGGSGPVGKPCASLGGSCSCTSGQECLAQNKKPGSSDCADTCCLCTEINNPVDAFNIVFEAGVADSGGNLIAANMGSSVEAFVGEKIWFDPVTKSVLADKKFNAMSLDNDYHPGESSHPTTQELHWTFAPVVYSYSKAGSYTARLVVEFSDGTPSVVRTIDVVVKERNVPAGSCTDQGFSCGCPGEKVCKDGMSAPELSGCASPQVCCKECVDAASEQEKTCAQIDASAACACPGGKECKTENYVTGSSDCEGTCCKCTDISYKLRLLFVPMDWSFDMTQTTEQEKYMAQIDTLKSYLVSKIPLSGCPEKIFADYSFSVCSANYPSDYQTLESEENLAVSQKRIDKYQQALIDCKNALDASKVASADQVLFVSDKNLAGGVAGTSYKTSGLIWFDMFYDAGTGKTLVHELGHKWGLADEYFDGCDCQSFNPCYNHLDANYNGGDPYGTYVGAAKQGMFSPYCSTSGASQCPQGGTAVCEGNMNSNNGRCIMSHGNAADPREFCPLCMAHLNSLDQLKCN
jgi:PKD repeat protein